MDKSLLEDQKTVLATDYVPQYEQLIMHPEDGKNCQINNSLSNIKKDMKFIDDFAIEKGGQIRQLMNDTISRLENSQNNINAEVERLQDIRMLCNKYTDFDKVVLLNEPDKLYGKFNYADGVFTNYVESTANVDISVDDIIGNGMPGNEYVCENYKFTSDTMNTGKSSALVDNSNVSYWEYQRITASSTEDYLINDFHEDSEEAKCTISLVAKENINYIKLFTTDENIKVIGLQYSFNGIDYFNATIPEITLNTKLDSYSKYGYVYGSCVLSVPNVQYVKVTLQSNGTTNDTLAYARVLFEDKDIQTDYNNIIDDIVTVKSAKRHVIKLNGIYGYKHEYDTNSYIQTPNLIKDNKYYSAAVFANVYIPEELDVSCVTFILTVNGIDHKVIPVNNAGNGIKVIRFSYGKSATQYTELIDEAIVSLRLTIKLKGTRYECPYVNNLKILLGGDIS